MHRHSQNLDILCWQTRLDDFYPLVGACPVELQRVITLFPDSMNRVLVETSNPRRRLMLQACFDNVSFAKLRLGFGDVIHAYRPLIIRADTIAQMSKRRN